MGIDKAQYTALKDRICEQFELKNNLKAEDFDALPEHSEQAFDFIVRLRKNTSC